MCASVPAHRKSERKIPQKNSAGPRLPVGMNATGMQMISPLGDLVVDAHRTEILLTESTLHSLNEKRRRIAALVHAHRPALLKIARRLCGTSGVEPEDLVQETLERALAHFEQLEEKAVEAREAWLGTTLTNRFLDHCRRRKTEARAQQALGTVQEQETSLEGAAREAWEQVPDAAFQDAINRLDEKHRAAYVLHAQGHKYQAISRQLGVPMGTVATWLYQARGRLRKLLAPLVLGEPQEQEPEWQ
jgi:RNA polymerase sigma-70 factor, ECF subfamily